MALRSIQRRVLVESPRDAVWRAISDPKQLSRWVCETAHLRPEVGAPFRWEWGGGLHADGQIEELVEAELLQLSYRIPMFTETLTHPTRVRFDLSDDPESTGTRVQLTHSEFLVGEDWDGYFEGQRQCWDVDLRKLQSMVEHGVAGQVLRVELKLRSDVGLSEVRKCLEGEDEAEVAGRDHGGLRYETQREGRRVRIDVFEGEGRVVLTEAYRDDECVDERTVYGRWSELLAPFATGEVVTGTPYDY